ncbi:hypothetical protein [Vreelandella neptunia]|uniref:Uncharacterized protein n=1 Tax=Vreelandella neptunia TaxID=115551 RepID=A0ABS9S1K1_9GAMM|nr:hypothetical protein [Halomonas neptunia]MCH4809976.1 hypothetical protein [Halomonas neptunia]
MNPLLGTHRFMCTRDLVARGKPKAHPREQRVAVPGFGVIMQELKRRMAAPV